MALALGIALCGLYFSLDQQGRLYGSLRCETKADPAAGHITRRVVCGCDIGEEKQFCGERYTLLIGW